MYNGYYPCLQDDDEIEFYSYMYTTGQSIHASKSELQT